MFQVSASAHVHLGYRLGGVQVPKDNGSLHGTGDQQQVREGQGSDGGIVLERLEAVMGGHRPQLHLTGNVNIILTSINSPPSPHLLLVNSSTSYNSIVHLQAQNPSCTGTWNVRLSHKVL